MLRNAAEWCRGAAARLIAPPCCAACDAPLPDDGLFCAPCAADVPAFPGGVETLGGVPLIASAVYEGKVAEVIRRFKYAGRPDLARPLALRVAGALRAAALPGPLLVVPVPLHGKRLAERAYNQSALVAAELGKVLGFGVRARALVRQRETREQALLLRSDRLLNVTSAFAVRDGALLGSERILLVDDVVTTGATVLACAGALREAGGVVVAVAAIARAGLGTAKRAGEIAPRQG